MSLVPRPVLDAFGVAATADATAATSGLINQTVIVREGARRLVLQRVNPIFGPAVHHDIDAITAHLESRGLATPRLLRTNGGDLWTTDGEGRVWRALTFVEGRTVDTVQGPAMARSAGALVGRFHRAVSTLEHTFHFTRPGAHDTPAHLRRLEHAVAEHRGHANHGAVAPVAERILAMAARLPLLPAQPRRIIHGDLKISNLLFRGGDEAFALVDLDTLAHLTIPVELGDAMRSWCNPAGEDAGSVSFNAATYAAAVAGYASTAADLLTPSERDALPAGAQTIALELSARFCADALNESYFGWNPHKFPSRSEHNRVRALAQVNLAADIERQRGSLEELTARAFAAPR